MSRSIQLVRGLGLAVVLLSLLAPGVLAQGDNWAVAQRDDAGILKVVKATQKFVEQVPGADDAAAVILYKEANFRTLEEGHERCSNLIFQVQDPAGIEQLTAPWFSGVEEGSERSAFIVRGEEVTRFDSGKAKIESAEDDIHLDRIRFQLEDLKKGDVVGWSVVLKRDGPLFMQRVPAVDRFPVVYSSCRIFNHGSSNFSVTAHGVSEDQFKLKTSGLINDRPEKWSANLKVLEAVPDLPFSSPYPLDTPVFNIAMTETHLEIENFYTGWMPVTGKVTIAGILGAGRRQILDEGGGLDVHASALTTGLATTAEKEKAVFEFVRDKISLISGEGYDQGANRAAKDVLKSKQATHYEKAALMIAMLAAVEVDAQLGITRPESWGPVEEVDEFTFTSFYTQVVRCGGDEGRIYAPQYAEVEAGRLPAEWGKAQVFSPKPGVADEIQAYNEKIRTQAFAEQGRLDMRQIALDAEAHGEKEGWFHIDVVE